MKRLLTLTLLVLAIVFTFTGIALAEDLTASDVKAIKPSGFKASSYSYTKIKCTWNEIEGVDGYIVYRATSKDGKYTKAYTTSDPQKLSYINTNRTTGKTYYYKLRGYIKINGKTVYTKYSAVDDAYARPAKVKGLEAYGQAKGIGIDLNWNAVTGATGYQQQINEYKNGKWSGWKSYTYYDDKKETFDTYDSLLKITKKQFPGGYVEGIVGKDEDGRPITKKMTVEEYTLMSLSKTQARIDVVEDETVYKFRVRAYHTEKGKKIYGLWSDEYTLTENINIDEIKAALRQYAIDYAAEHNPKFVYYDSDDYPSSEEASYAGDGDFAGFSIYAKQEDVIEAYKEDIERYITKPSRMEDPNPAYLYIRKTYPGEKLGVGWNVSLNTYYKIWMMY